MFITATSTISFCLRVFDRERFLQFLNARGVMATSHYEPLHNSPAGKRYGKVSEELKITESVAQQIIRLPLWVGLSSQSQEEVVNVIAEAFKSSVGFRRYSK